MPPRYSEASLIKKLEELGIGRPSTYAATLKTLEDREYVTIDKRRLTPQAKGRLVTAFLENFFEKYVEYDFTASLEEKLDEISDGKLAWKDVLRDFWKDFSAHVDETKELRVSDVLDALNEELAPLVFPAREDGSDPRICPKCGTGNLSLKLGKYGAFVGCSTDPECGYTRQLGGEANGNGENGAVEDGTKLLGKDPYTAEEITLRSGRFGPYVQRGEGKEAKRSSLPKGWAAAEIDHEKALALLSLPRDVGGARAVWSVRAARRRLREPRIDRGRVLDRAQPRRRGDRGEAGEGQGRAQWRRPRRTQGSRPAPRRRRRRHRA